MRPSLFIIGTLLLAFCNVPSTTYDVKREQLVTCETGNGTCKPIEVARRKEDRKTIVRFLISSYNTEIQVFDSSYRNQIIRRIHEDSIKPILNDYIKEGSRPALDITSLADGKYYVQITGEDVGGMFELNLKTKD